MMWRRRLVASRDRVLDAVARRAGTEGRPVDVAAAQGPRIGPYPIGVRVLLGGVLLDEAAFARPEMMREFIVATYRKVVAYGKERSEMRIEITLAIDARDAVQDDVLAHLSAIQGDVA